MSPDNPQPAPYRNQVSPEELASLIDGEIADMNRIEQLKAMLQGDHQLRADYDAQRRIKLLLAELPPAEAPSFMATRIMGEISAQRNQRRGKVWLPNWGAAAAAVALFGMGYGATVQFGQQAARVAPVLMMSESETPTEGITAGGPVTAGPSDRLMQTHNLLDVQPALGGSDDVYQTVYAASTDVELPAEVDPWLREFIMLGNEAHNYSRAMRLTHNHVSPDVSQAVMVVDSR